MKDAFSYNYVRCDILTGRIYRCLTSMFQEFLDIQFSSKLGTDWMNRIVTMAQGLENAYNRKQEWNNLRALCNKKNDKGCLADKSCIDVTIANSLMLFTCYYLAAVPEYTGLSDEDMRGIIQRCEKNPETSYMNCDTEALRSKLLDCIKADIRVVLMCQDKMTTQIMRNGKTEPRKNGKIENDDFYKRVQDLVNTKNRLNSHMSIINNSVASLHEISGAQIYLQDFITHLNKTWENPAKDAFVAKYQKEINIIRYLIDTTEFASVTNAFVSVIDSIPREVLDAKPNLDNHDPNVAKRQNSLTRSFSLLSNAKDHCAACIALTIESNSQENICANIMLAFMYYCGWATGRSYEEILMPVSFLSDPDDWLVLAQDLQKDNREQAAAYYIGYGMVNNSPSAFEMAGYLGIRLENFELTKACCKYARHLNEKIESWYVAFEGMDEAEFKVWAAEVNRRG